MKQYGLAILFPAIALGFDLGDLQIHGTIAQGGLLSSHNNYLTAKTSQGSTQWTEGAVNLGSSVTDSLHVGVQIHTYRLGELGKLRLQVDWAYGDYRIRDWLGFRAGKVKTPLGLFNDTQDIDSLHLWALLPQGVYPADDREWTLAHTGGDVYGVVRLTERLGELSYQGYFGSRTIGPHVGYFIMAAERGLAARNDASGRLYGGDLRWHTPLPGLSAGGSVGMADVTGPITVPYTPLAMTLRSTADTTTAFYSQFERGRFYAAGEYRRHIWNFQLVEPGVSIFSSDSRAWYAMAAYRVHPKVNVGAYYSSTHLANFWTPALADFLTPEMKDWVVSTRIDVNRYLYLKFEGHYMDGTTLGFYTATNPIRPDRVTHLLVARIGFTF